MTKPKEIRPASRTLSREEVAEAIRVAREVRDRRAEEKENR